MVPEASFEIIPAPPNKSNLSKFWVKIAGSKKMPNNVYKNIPTQYDCSAAYCATNLTVFETEFKLNK